MNSRIFFDCIIFYNYWDSKKLLNTTMKKKKKHNKILVLARYKLNIIETLMSHALIDYDISHEDF